MDERSRVTEVSVEVQAAFDPVPRLASPFGADVACAGRRLLLAVLQDAIDCYQKYATVTTTEGRRLFRQAERWLIGKRTTAVLSFEDVCQGLGLEPSYVRRGLSLWRHRKRGAAAHRRDPLLRRSTRKAS